MRQKTILIFAVLTLTQNVFATETTSTQNKIKYFGEPAPRTLLLGMWTTHLWTNQFGLIQGNYLVGYVDHGYFIGTFTNSYSHRSYAAGINRYWLTKPLSENIQWHLGYRLGLVYGYRKGEVLFSSHSPLIPFIQLVSDFNWKKIGIELSTTGQVISGGFYLNF